jgi:DNA-directed RNA polymerase specialized sigma subunit
LDLGNLAKHGFAGLIEAARIYTPQSRVPFRIYVRHCIKGAILDGLLSGTALPRAMLSERRCLPNTSQMRTSTGMGMQEAERGDECLRALFRLQEHLEYSENTGDRVKLPKKVGSW